MSSIRKTEPVRSVNRKLIITGIIISALLQILLIFNKNVWNDEATTIIYILRPMRQLMDTIRADDHPPLYYLLLKGMTAVFGYHFTMVKLFSALPVIAMHIWTGALVLRSRKAAESLRTGVYYLLFLCATTFEHNFMYLSTEIRMYSLAMFFVTMSGIYAFKVYREAAAGKVSRRTLAVFILVSLGGAYTHHFATLSEAFIYLYLFIFLLRLHRKNIRLCAACTGLTFIGYLPWLPVLLGQVGLVKDDSRYAFAFGDLRRYLEYVTGMEYWRLLILGGIVMTAVYALLQAAAGSADNAVGTNGENGENGAAPADAKYAALRERTEETVFGLCAVSVVFLVILTGFIVNIVISPVFTVRYVTVALGLFWLGLTVLLEYSTPRRLFTILYAALILFLSLNGYLGRLSTEYDTGTDAIVKYFRETAGPQDYILTNNEHLRISVLQFYFPGCTIADINDADFENREIGGRPIDRAVWYFEDTAVPERDKSYIDAAGYNCIEVNSGNFDNSYYFRLYLIGAKPEQDADPAAAGGAEDTAEDARETGRKKAGGK